MNIDWSKAPEGATHWSSANDRGRLEAYWRPDGDGMYDCWAVTESYGGNKWQRNRTDLPEYAIARPTAWAGECMPPLGIEFEWRYGDMEWKKGEALYIGEIYVILKSIHGGEQHYYLRDMQFRPIRTPEQIAAEERAAAIEEMRNIYAGSSETTLASGMSALYDAGYRKQVTP